MPVYTLDIAVDYDFELIGISSHEKDYRLAWALNKNMDWMLCRQDDVELNTNKNISSFALFEYQHPLEMVTIALLSNKSENGFLLPELQQFDYVLKIENMQQSLDDTFFKRLRKTPFVQTLLLVDISKLKSKQNLIYNNITE